MKSFFESRKVEPHQKDMYDGIVDILLRVKDLENRKEIAEYMMENFKKENIKVSETEFLKDCKIN
jgi:hypothetical protein